MQSVQWIKKPEPTSYTAALFDFDGTISLIREGWQPIMYGYFVEVLKETPRAEKEQELQAVVQEFVDRLTGQQTIYQCIQLAEEVQARGGEPQDPLDYKKEYNHRLLRHIQDRVQGLQEGRIARDELLVPGVEAVLSDMYQGGLQLYLASGTDEEYVIAEAQALAVDKYFNGGIFGALDDYRRFSKAMVIQDRILPKIGSSKEFIGFGDGFVEIENVQNAGGLAVGVASDEANRSGIDRWKQKRLLEAGAHCIIADFRCWPQLRQELWGGNEHAVFHV